MANYKRKANHKVKRSCGLCKPHKRIGNSKKLAQKRQRLETALLRYLGPSDADTQW